MLLPFKQESFFFDQEKLLFEGHHLETLHLLQFDTLGTCGVYMFQLEWWKRLQKHNLIIGLGFAMEVVGQFRTQSNLDRS